MLNTLEAFAWLAAAALILKALDYQIPFAHHFDQFKTPVEVEQQVKPQVDPFDPGVTADNPATGFEQYWGGVGGE
jgi:pyruvate/2-oxoacid:ferredoxin oxidoreductase alpha subunit